MKDCNTLKLNNDEIYKILQLKKIRQINKNFWKR